MSIGRGVMIGACVLFATFAACAEDGPEATCDAPDHVTYSCQPTDGPGCSGGPIWRGATDHPENVYPAGCFADMPECSGIRKGHPVTEMCGNFGSGLSWGIPG